MLLENELPDCCDGFEIPEKGVFSDKRDFYHFGSGNNNFIMKLRDLFGLCHLLKDFVVKGDNGIIL